MMIDPPHAQTMPTGENTTLHDAPNAAGGLIPAARLASADRILFIAHLALGDFTYLQNDFRAFAQAYPHLRIDLWIDEVRRTDNPAHWPHLKNYVLYDWAAGCGLFGRVYRDTYSPALFEQSVSTAQQEQYPIVVSLATLRPHRYAALARRIAPRGFVTGVRAHNSWFLPHHLLAYHKLDASLAEHMVSPTNPQHISSVYADMFARLAGVSVPPATRFPFVDIPDRWLAGAAAQLAAWGVNPVLNRLVFINPYAKTRKRCWPLQRVSELIRAMQSLPQWKTASFIINAVPQELAEARRFFQEHGSPRTELFSAEENFYQLPAMLSQCSLIISVETAVMHLANAVQVPVIALMRQKNPEWVPIDTANSTVIVAARRRDWVKEIAIAPVLEALP